MLLRREGVLRAEMDCIAIGVTGDASCRSLGKRGMHWRSIDLRGFVRDTSMAISMDCLPMHRPDRLRSMISGVALDLCCASEGWPPRRLPRGFA